MQGLQGGKKSAIVVSALRRVYILTLPKQVVYCILNALYGVMYLSFHGDADFQSGLH